MRRSRPLRSGWHTRDWAAGVQGPAVDAYANWKTLHEGVLVLVQELDRYITRFARWASDEEILPSA